MLAQKALEFSLDEQFDSPFAQEARRSGYIGAIGGKSDDISVTVGRVKLASKDAQEEKDKETRESSVETAESR